MRGRVREHLMKEKESDSKEKKNRQGQTAPFGAFVLLAKGPPSAGGNR